jgi:hypothetical protein
MYEQRRHRVKKDKKGGRSDKPVLAKDAHLYPHLSKFGGRKNYGHQPSTPEKFEQDDGRLYQ